MMSVLPTYAEALAVAGGAAIAAAQAAVATHGLGAAVQEKNARHLMVKVLEVFSAPWARDLAGLEKFLKAADLITISALEGDADLRRQLLSALRKNADEPQPTGGESD
jgi:hypothetical protein